MLRLYRVGSGLRTDLGRQLGPHVVRSLPRAQEFTWGADGEAVDVTKSQPSALAEVIRRREAPVAEPAAASSTLESMNSLTSCGGRL